MTIRFSRSLGLAVPVALAVAAWPGSASAATAVEYTGCLTRAGSVVNLKEGLEPLSPCNGGQTLIHINVPVAYGDLTGRPDLTVYATNAQVTQAFNTLADVATSGAYGDLTGRPDLSVYATNFQVTQAFNTLAQVATTGAYGDLTGRPDLSVYATNFQVTQAFNTLAQVATTGAYGDLSGRPDLSVYVTNAQFNEAFDSLDVPSVEEGAPLSNDPCEPGDIEWNPSYVYVCVDQSSWRRSALSTY
jgi:hypothetical protein